MNELSENYYDILEVLNTSSPDEIKASFRSLAHKYHPDKNFGDKICEEKFRSILIAYETLSDSENRIKYDCFLRDNNSPKFKNTNSSELSINDVVNILNDLNTQLKNIKKNNGVNVNLLYNIINDLLSPELVIGYLQMSDINNKNFIVKSIIGSFFYLPVYLIEKLQIKMEIIISTKVLVANDVKHVLRIRRRLEIFYAVMEFFFNNTFGRIILVLVIISIIALMADTFS